MILAKVPAADVAPDTKLTKNTKCTKKGEGHEESGNLYFVPFFVSFVVGRSAAAALR